MRRVSPLASAVSRTVATVTTQCVPWRVPVDTLPGRRLILLHGVAATRLLSRKTAGKALARLRVPKRKQQRQENLWYAVVILLLCGRLPLAAFDSRHPGRDRAAVKGMSRPARKPPVPRSWKRAGRCCAVVGISNGRALACWNSLVIRCFVSCRRTIDPEQ